jgi:hypothetical protein
MLAFVVLILAFFAVDLATGARNESATGYTSPETVTVYRTVEFFHTTHQFWSSLRASTFTFDSLSDKVFEGICCGSTGVNSGIKAKAYRTMSDNVMPR